MIQRLNAWLEKLSATSGVNISNLDDLLAALRKRHDDFHAVGGRLSDHGLPYTFSTPCTREEAENHFLQAKEGNLLSQHEQDQLASFLFHFSAILDGEKDWTKQLHLGPIRNNNSRLFKTAGPDIGCDSMNDDRQIEPLSRFLDSLVKEGKLPKVIVYNMNPRDSMGLATMIGNFQSAPTAGRMQYGSGWWFLDTKPGMEEQINILSSTGLLSTFVGMLTDSRSFLSFTRHEYFRRILCNLIGQDIENGEIPNDPSLTGNLIENICYNNARNYFGFTI